MDGVSAPRLTAGNTDPKLALQLSQKETGALGFGGFFGLGYVPCQNGRNIHFLADESTTPMRRRRLA